MTARSPTRSASNLLIVMLLLSGVGVTLPAATALAEDCLAAPNSPAREATRWYYRLDRATQHKCWYMGALDRPAQQVAAPAKTALPATAFAIPIPRPRPSTAGSGLALRQADTDPSFSHAEYAIPIPRPRPSAVSLSQDDTGPSAAHAEEIAAKPSVTPPVSEFDRRDYAVNSKEIHFTASRHIVGRTSRRNYIGDLRDASRSAIARD